ncbi:hypothetical protein NV379_05305 [Paenibacillus sp. N1-5-1-14]|uniref:hypothetical protein n=1 Tax=Paenibacillus radicibacter TaxID=2972488 RepID=UPI002159B20A|nr:hypothetical protein [Paenibacillus radicibacter]MCR8642069.1 hypothetical protein [Paenibacillus radicibacter]
MKSCYHFRFIAEDAKSLWKDLTFRFYRDGSVTITNNDTDVRIHPKQLSGAALDFYIRKRIYLIKTDLQEKIVKYA